jgi:superfamily II DNA or RNA helicase
VEQYQRLAAGRRGVTFTTDVQTAQELAARYMAVGVPAEAIWADTPDVQRFAAKRRLASGELLQLINVDIFGEGFDLPAVEVVSFLRPTASFGLFVQQFGRALRPGPRRAIVIDHVGNVERHGLPDTPRRWTLDSRDRRTRAADDSEAPPVRACHACAAIFDRALFVCPYCGHVQQPRARSTPEQVDGDLYELDAAALARLRGEVERVDRPVDVYAQELARRGCPSAGFHRNLRAHEGRQGAQAALRAAISQWAGYQRAAGHPDAVSYRRFFLTFGTDVLTAQTLGVHEAETLAAQVRGAYQ